MCICDGGSDGCSSDLFKGGGFDPRGSGIAAPDLNGNGVSGAGGDYADVYDFLSFDPESVTTYEIGWKAALFGRRVTIALDGFWSDYKDVQIRSEEHTSELQSLMRISYAVFFLQKKNKKTN